jgi:hypothetical protein
MKKNYRCESQICKFIFLKIMIMTYVFLEGLQALNRPEMLFRKQK